MKYIVKASVPIEFEIECMPDVAKFKAESDLSMKFRAWTLLSITPKVAAGDPAVAVWTPPDIGASK